MSPRQQRLGELKAARNRLIVDDRGRTWKEPANTTWTTTDCTDQEETP